MRHLPITKISSLLQELNRDKLIHVVDFIEGITDTCPHGDFEDELKEEGVDTKEIAIVHLCYALAPLPPTEVNFALHLCENYIINEGKVVETV